MFDQITITRHTAYIRYVKEPNVSEYESEYLSCQLLSNTLTPKKWSVRKLNKNNLISEIYFKSYFNVFGVVFQHYSASCWQ